MKNSVFKLDYFLTHQEKFHVARVNITSSHDLSLHSHDYAEILWIEKGSGYHHINGYKNRLGEGDLIMIRPQDSHTFSPLGKEGLTLINIAFSPDILAFFKARYFEHSTLYFWSPHNLPFQMHLSKRVLRRISSRAEECMKYSRSYLQLDSLLLFIFRQITANENFDNQSEIPAWLFNAIHEYNKPELFAQGIAGFVSLCARNVDYVNRVVKLHFYKTLTDLVNESRMRYATTQLAITSMPIKEICINCGFQNLGHFYRVFKSIYDQTPSEYRKINQMIV